MRRRTCCFASLAVLALAAGGGAGRVPVVAVRDAMSGVPVDVKADSFAVSVPAGGCRLVVVQ